MDFPLVVRAGDLLPDRRVEEAERHGVLLQEDRMGERGGAGLRVVQLRHRRRAVGHGLTGIHQQPGHQVGVLLVLLEKIPVRSPEHLPVEVAQIVPGRVFAVLGELQREAFERRAVPADPISFHDGSREKPQRLGARERLGIE